MRGLHFQKPPFAQSKLVRVIKGAVLDVAVDIRKGSPTFGQHVAVELTEDNHRQFFIPRGFAHGFSVLSDEVIFQYKCDNFYAPQSEGAIAWNDPALKIDWRILRRRSSFQKKTNTILYWPMRNGCLIIMKIYTKSKHKKNPRVRSMQPGDFFMVLLFTLSIIFQRILLHTKFIQVVTTVAQITYASVSMKCIQQIQINI